MEIKPRPLSTLDTIRYHGWLNYISEELRQAVLERCHVRSAAAGDIIFRIGDPSDGVYGVVSGAFAFEVAPIERGPQLVHAFTAGTWVGEAEIFTNRARLGTLVALRASEYLFLSLAHIEQLAESGLDIWRGLGALAGSHVELALVAIDDLTIRPPKERIAAILLRFAGARLSDVPDDPIPVVKITQTDLAKIANTSRSTVVRVLGKFEAAGSIEPRYGSITLLDCQALRDGLADT
jgi:CRP-like cAMP-binding protein